MPTATQTPLDKVSDIIDTYPSVARQRFQALRTLIFTVAKDTPAIGPLTETLKWGEPAYLTQASKAGTTVRLAWKPKTPDTISLFVNCNTSLVEDWRAHYGEQLSLIGNREIRLALDAPLPTAALKHCIAMALTYHLRKSNT